MSKSLEVEQLVNPPVELIGWHRLVEKDGEGDAERKFPLPAYSEFMPPPRLGWTPLGGIDHTFFPADDPYGWLIPEVEEEYEFRPGLERIVRQVMEPLIHLGRGLPAYTIGGHHGENLHDNPYWPPELADSAGKIPHERYVAFLPMAFSRTQDDKGRVLWTLLGASEMGPEKVFWKSFFTAPGKERPAEESLSFFFELLAAVYQEAIHSEADLKERGFRILPEETKMDSLPSWTQPFLDSKEASYQNVRYLLTFRPFGDLPEEARKLYLAGRLNLLPFPGSLVFWGMPTYLHLEEELPEATQISLLHLVARHHGPDSIRVLQTGWLHEVNPKHQSMEVQEELLRQNYSRSNRWDRMARYQDELALNLRLQKVSQVLFSTDLDVLGLYDKPMARNCQIWTQDFQLLLNGPRATPEDLRRAEAILTEGGLFGYRFQFPPMRVGRFSVTWHRPLVAYLASELDQVEMPVQKLSGYLTASPQTSIEPIKPVELWPRFLRRPEALSALHDFQDQHDHYSHQTGLNILSLLDVWRQMGSRPLPRSFARSLLRIAHEDNLEGWLKGLPGRTVNQERGQKMQAFLDDLLEPTEQSPALPQVLTFEDTSTRAFEQAYWNDILFLSQGEYHNKDNADIVKDEATQASLDQGHTQRELDRIGDYLLGRHRMAIHQAGMQDSAVCGELPFRWQTDFDFPFFDGWKKNQAGTNRERDLLVVIPGIDRSQAVVLADHYDTAYEEDTYDRSRGGSGARLSAAGADDNYSATAVLLEAAPIFLKLAREGRLRRDVWLLHLTGEEFPADCLGARHFCQAMLEKMLQLHLESGKKIDLSGTRLKAIFVMDMIAHNRDYGRDIFQISPGHSQASLALAYQAHLVNLAWNKQAQERNRSSERQGLGRGHRSVDGMTIPEIAAHLEMTGEVRTRDDPASSLYNTDAQIFSDVGAPVVLFMENYDINRTGYHDSHDTMENIDLDYGAAMAAIAIESAAQLATL
jgi:hypothetical protein